MTATLPLISPAIEGSPGPSSIAVLGAGIQGTCSALELARRGWQVDLIDRDPQPLMGASGFNEGKIHLGFVYGNEPFRHTSRLMVTAGFSFLGHLRRWLGSSWQAPNVSTPFIYSLHRRSLLGRESIERHFNAIRSMIAEQCLIDDDYLGSRIQPEAVYQPIDPSSVGLDPTEIPAAWQTVERAIDSAAVAEDLRAAVARCSAIRFVADTEVLAAAPTQDDVSIETSRGGTVTTCRYQQVVNALWDGRLAVDLTAGVAPHRRWLHRFKYGMVIHGAKWHHPVSTTVVLGPFGDIVSYPSGNIYLSWYPDCLAATSQALVPEPQPRELPEPARSELIHKSLAALSAIYPPLAELSLGGDVSIQLAGRPIFSWGDQVDIDQHDSKLHSRADVGVASHGRYHTVNTGKYTLGPMLAVELAQQVDAVGPR